MTDIRTRAESARKHPGVTCPASRHVHMMAENLIKSGYDEIFNNEPDYAAESMLAVVAALWEARARIAELENALRPLVELNITYWDAQGEIRCNPGKTQQESMAIVHKARAAIDSAKGAG